MFYFYQDGGIMLILCYQILHKCGPTYAFDLIQEWAQVSSQKCCKYAEYFESHVYQPRA